MCKYYVIFFFKQKTAYEMRISDWSSDVCSSDRPDLRFLGNLHRRSDASSGRHLSAQLDIAHPARHRDRRCDEARTDADPGRHGTGRGRAALSEICADLRSEEHTSELQSLMRISYAVFCLKKKNDTNKQQDTP